MNVNIIRIDAIGIKRVKALELVNLLDGGDGTRVCTLVVIYSPDLDEPAQLSVHCLALIQHLLQFGEADCAELRSKFGDSVVAETFRANVLLPGQNSGGPNSAQPPRIPIDELSRASIQHSKWQGLALNTLGDHSGSMSLRHLVEEYGSPPTHDYRRYWSPELPLPPSLPLSLDAVLSARKTTRRFKVGASINIQDLATILSRTFGATDELELVRGLTVHRKNTPSGGGLHPVEAYALVSRVDGLPAGVYHYISANNSLERLSLPQEGASTAPLLLSTLAHQTWASDVSTALLLTVRLDRLYWRYRFHTKALRVAHMDAGHLSQVAYMVATELGLGVIVTAAINERDTERLLTLDPTLETPVAAIGLGVRADS